MQSFWKNLKEAGVTCFFLSLEKLGRIARKVYNIIKIIHVPLQLRPMYTVLFDMSRYSGSHCHVNMKWCFTIMVGVIMLDFMRTCYWLQVQDICSCNFCDDTITEEFLCVQFGLRKRI